MPSGADHPAQMQQVQRERPGHERSPRSQMVGLLLDLLLFELLKFVLITAHAHTLCLMHSLLAAPVHRDVDRHMLC